MKLIKFPRTTNIATAQQLNNSTQFMTRKEQVNAIEK